MAVPLSMEDDGISTIPPTESACTPCTALLDHKQAYLRSNIPLQSPHQHQHTCSLIPKLINTSTQSYEQTNPAQRSRGRRHGSHAAYRDDRRRGRGGGAGGSGDVGGRHHLRAGELRHRPLPLLRPWPGLRALRGLLQRREEPQLRRQHQRRQAHRLQLPQERRRTYQRPQRRQRRQHPLQVRRQHPLHHQHLHRLLQGELNLNDDDRRLIDDPFRRRRRRRSIDHAYLCMMDELSTAISTE